MIRDALSWFNQNSNAPVSMDHVIRIHQKIEANFKPIAHSPEFDKVFEVNDFYLRVLMSVKRNESMESWDAFLPSLYTKLKTSFQKTTPYKNAFSIKTLTDYTNLPPEPLKPGLDTTAIEPIDKDSVFAVDDPEPLAVNIGMLHIPDHLQDEITKDHLEKFSSRSPASFDIETRRVSYKDDFIELNIAAIKSDNQKYLKEHESAVDYLKRNQDLLMCWEDESPQGFGLADFEVGNAASTSTLTKENDPTDRSFNLGPIFVDEKSMKPKFKCVIGKNQEKRDKFHILPKESGTCYLSQARECFKDEEIDKKKFHSSVVALLAYARCKRSDRQQNENLQKGLDRSEDEDEDSVLGSQGQRKSLQDKFEKLGKSYLRLYRVAVVFENPVTKAIEVKPFKLFKRYIDQLVKLSEREKGFVCLNKCEEGKVFTRTTMEDHYELQLAKAFICIQCGNEFCTTRHFGQHYTKMHVDPGNEEAKKLRDDAEIEYNKMKTGSLTDFLSSLDLGFETNGSQDPVEEQMSTQSIFKPKSQV